MTDINVIARTQHIIVDPASSSVSVINMGPAGPAGPPGVGGTAAGTTVVDVGNHFQPDNVEDILQVIAGQIDTRDVQIQDHETRLVTNEAKIAADDIRIGVNESAISSQGVLNGSIAQELQDLTNRADGTDARLDNEEAASTDHETRLIAEEAATVDHDTRIETNRVNVQDHENRVTVVESELLALDGKIHAVDQGALETSGGTMTGELRLEPVSDSSADTVASTVLYVREKIAELAAIVDALDTLTHDHINSQAILNTSITSDLTAIHSRLDALENP